MNTEPSSGIDWATVTQWGAWTGAFLVAVFAALFRRGPPDESLAGKSTVTDTKVVTADSSAMEMLAGSIEANSLSIDANTRAIADAKALTGQVVEHLGVIREEITAFLTEEREQRAEDEKEAARKRGYEEGLRDGEKSRRQPPIRRSGDP